MIYRHNRVNKKKIEVPEPEKTTFYIIRHGQTPLNANDEIRGWLNVPLDDKGHKDARKMGEELKNEGIDCLYVSDLLRTRETAQEIQKESGIPIKEVVFWLRPWNLGKYTGKPVKDSMASIKHYATDEPLISIPEGESFYEFKNRFFEGIFGLRYGGKKIGLVTHHRNDRLFAAWERAGMLDNRALDLDVMFQKGIKPGTWRKQGDEVDTEGSDT